MRNAIRIPNNDVSRMRFLKNLIQLFMLGQTKESGMSIVTVTEMLKEKGYSDIEIQEAIDDLVAREKIESI